MKCNSDKVYNQKAKLAKERADKERAEMLASMSDEERETFLKEEKERHDAAVKTGGKALADLLVLKTMLGGPYSNNKF